MPETESPSKSVPPKDNRFKTWILVTHNDVFNPDNTNHSEADIVKLRHPRTGLGALFLFSADNSVVQEVFSFSEKRSWFINNSSSENGKMYFSTPVDPLFLILPYLQRSKDEGKVMPLIDLLTDELFPESCRLLKCASKYIHLLAERKGPDDLNAWMYDEEKTLQWLCKKSEKVFQILKDKNINTEGGACSKNFVKSTVKDDSSSLNRNLYLKYSHELVSEYLREDLSRKLLSSLRLPNDCLEEKSINKRKQSQQMETELTKNTKRTKKIKLEDGLNCSSSLENPKDCLGKGKTRTKVTHGSRTITSFFK